jgi:serine/threonine protein kinase
MSPEQLRAEQLDGRADLYALGVVLFEALSGERPFQGEHDPATIMKILSGERASLVGIAPATPPELCAVVESLLATDRNDRPANASAVLELLDPFVPPPRKRRELGTMASDLRDAQITRSSEAPISGSEMTDLKPERPGEASGVSRTSGSLASGAKPEVAPKAELAQGRDESTPTSRRGLAWAIFGILATLLAIMLWPVLTRDSPPQQLRVERREAVAEPAAEPPSVEAKAQSAAAPTSPDEVAAGTEPAAATSAVRPARLTVVVFPWGDVWIDGKRRGSAPLKNIALKPGRYKISAGRERPSKSKTIRVREAQRKTVQFDLTE